MMNFDLNSIVCCPQCHNDFKADSFYCNDCDINFDTRKKKTDQLDLRFINEKNYNYKQKLTANKYKFNLPEEGDGVYSFNFGLYKNKNGFDFSSVKNKKKQEKLLSWIPQNGGIAIDIGTSMDEGLSSYMKISGHNLIRTDYDSCKADILLDVHSLPFKDNSIDLIINLAVMEHVEYPHIAGREFYRVLKKDGVLLTNVAFLQQQHDSSWYHFTHFGVYSWLTNSGFNPDKLLIDASGKRYHGIFTTSSLIGLPKLIKNIILYPVYFLHRILWKLGGIKLGKDLEQQRHMQTTGAINSVAIK